MNDDLTGRRVLVTGAAGGIGRAIAAHMVRAGATVAVSDAREEACTQVARELGTSTSSVRAITADLRVRADARACLRDAWEQLGGLDILVNAAGIYPSRLLLDMTDEEWDGVLGVNLDAPFALCTEFARALVAEERPGHIVNIASGAADRARPGAAHYCTSKAGLVMLTRALALELAPHRIHVNAVSPGFIAVDSAVNPLREEYVEAISGGQPWPRPGKPEDIAAAVAFLCSGESDWMTGTTVHVDGGSGAGNAKLPLS
ncbi:MAG: SDR family NAD(P)-dependent oxidoreductase [Streptosporangiales bacterium]